MRVDKKRKSLKESQIPMRNMKSFEDVAIGDVAVDFNGNDFIVIAKGNTGADLPEYDTTGVLIDDEYTQDVESVAVEKDGITYVYPYGGEGVWVENTDGERVHSFSFDFLITNGDSVGDIENRIINELNLIDGIEIVGNPRTGDESWTKEEYGLA